MRWAALVVSITSAACGFTGNTADDGPPGDDGNDEDADDDGIPDATDNCPDMANPPQRDHDVDGRGDECDLCPHLASATDPDGDGDGVGDDCDPRAGSDIRVVWHGFYDAAEIADWDLIPSGVWSIDPARGLLVRTGSEDIAEARLPGDRADVHVATRARVLSIAPASSYRSVGLSLGVLGNPAKQYYSCCPHQGGVAASTDLSYFGYWGQSTEAEVPLGVPIADGSEFGVEQTITAAGVTCSATTPAFVTLSSPTIGGSHHGQVVLWSDDYRVEFDYVFVVAIGG